MKISAITFFLLALPLISINASLVKMDSIPEWYNDYDVKFYKLDLEASDTAAYVSGNVTILSQVSANILDTFKFELFSGLTLDSVFADNRKTTFVRSGDVVSAALPHTLQHGQLTSVTIYYKGSVKSNGFFSPLVTQFDNAWNINITWTLSEPFGAKYWFPCKQYLSDKADSAWIFITIPKNCKAGSNGVLSGITPVGSNKVRYEWKTHYPIAFYLLSFAVADYQDYSFYTKLNDKDSVLVQNFIYDRPDYLKNNKPLIDKTADFLKYYSSVFGIYPFWKEKYGHCLAPLGGGMEHQTMTSLSSFEFLLVSHELSHQWFGDLVTCATWQDIWVNEGFASYSEYLADDALVSHELAVQWMVFTHWGALNDPNGSVFIPEKDKDNELRVFSNNLTYKKGAAIIHMLRYELNNDVLFFNILREYLKEFKDSVATGKDFIQVVNKLSGKDYSWFLNQWYYGNGYPLFDLSWKHVDNVLTVISNQKVSSDSPSFFKTHFDLKIINKNSDTIVRLYQDQPQQVFYIPVSGDVDSVAFDPNEWLLKKITIDKVPDLPSVDDYFKASPNPFSEEIKVLFRSYPDHDRIIKLIASNGKKILELNAKKQIEVSINTKNIMSGAYLLYVLEGKSTYIRKVIKVR